MVITKYGSIEGIKREDYTEYRGIPYAKAPIGELRWKEPQEMEPWEGVLQAVDFRNACIQDPPAMEPTDKDFYSDPHYKRPYSEDCLYLHIWVPNKIENKKLPVAFWIHGGAYLGGCGSEMEFDGRAYCRHSIILVSIEYRCNVFGFLAHPWLSEENERSISGNYGMLDQIAALKWVYENIEAFGGDKDKITVLGQSAGAMSVQALISSPLSAHMICGAIMQSGGSYGSGLLTDLPMEQAEKYGMIYVELLHARSLEELRKMSAEQIMAVLGEFIQKTAGMGRGMFKFIPNIDGYVLTNTYDKRIDDKKIPRIPYMLGTTKNDILVTKEMLEKHDFSELYKGCIAFSLKLEEIGYDPAYVYYFTRNLPGDNYGAWHSADLWYMFDTMDRSWRPWTERDYRLRDKMIKYWTNFIKYGDPNGDYNNGTEDIRHWKKCTKQNPYIEELS